jgi:hypothetical protein
MCPLKSIILKCPGHNNLPEFCLIVILFLLCFHAFGQVTGVSADGSSTLGKSRFMIGGYYSTIIPPGILWEDYAINQPGLKLGMGIADVVDIKFYYSRWAVRGSDYHQNVFQLITKVTGELHMLSLYLPFGLIHSKYKQAYDEDEIGKIWMIAPRMITTLKRKENFDFCIIPYLELLKEKTYKPVITGGINIGMGFYALAKKLAFRFEGGIDIRTLAEGFPCGTAGLGLSYVFGRGE